MRNILYVAFLLLLVGIWGCETSPTGTEFSSNEEAITQLMLDNLDGYFYYKDHYGEHEAKTEGSKAERYTSWWRQLVSVEGINISINIENDSAYVVFGGEVSGILHLFVYDTIPPDTIIHYPKDLNDNIIRYAIFKRYTDSLGYRGWRLENLSGVEIMSDPNTVGIDSIRIECMNYPDTVITDPLNLVKRRNILTFDPEVEVTLTIYSTDDTYAFFHARARRFGHRGWWRWEFDEVESGVWSGTWITPRLPGVRMAAFDILHKSTLDDNQYQYDSNAWVFPYIIE